MEERIQSLRQAVPKAVQSCLIISQLQINIVIDQWRIGKAEYMCYDFEH